MGDDSEALSHFNDRVRRMVAGTQLRHAAFAGDVAVIENIGRCPGLLLNSASMLGSLRENAAHVAAAAGNVAALRLLLDMHADPNAADHVNETPLHYSVF